MTQGQLIARRRAEIGLTQEELARRVPCTNMTLSKIERGLSQRPSQAIAAGIARELGLDVSAIRPPLARAA